MLLTHLLSFHITAFLGCICNWFTSATKIFFRYITAVFIAKMGIVAGHQFIIFAIRTHYNIFRFPSSSFLIFFYKVVYKFYNPFAVNFYYFIFFFVLFPAKPLILFSYIFNLFFQPLRKLFDCFGFNFIFNLFSI